MKIRSKLITAAAFVLVLGGLSAADYVASGGSFASLLGSTETESGNEGVAKNTGPDVEATMASLDLESEESDDLTLLGQIVNMDQGIRSLIVLHEGDRAGSVTWTQSPDVKQIFNALKEALIGAFSAQVTGLRDETIQEEGSPVRNVLSFTDPSISEEQIVFVRVRERLFEFHVAEGGEEAMNGLMQELTAR